MWQQRRVTTPEEIGARIALVRGELGLSQKAAAKLLGIGSTSLSNVETGQNVPSGETLLKFQSVGYNPGWILTGLGPKKLGAKPEATSADLQVFVGFLLEIAAEVEKVYRDNGARLNEYDLVHASTHWLGEIQKMVRNVGDIEELRSLLPWVAAQVKREIADANAGKTKRAASD